MDPREWLETDGLGGYAMGTAAGPRTRRYHALVCAATHPPGGRMVLVNGVEVFVEAEGGARWALSSQRYPGGVVYPDGASRMTGLAWEPWPARTYALEDGSQVREELVVARGAARVWIRWHRRGGAGGTVRLWVRPLLSGRDHHALHHENPAFRFAARCQGARVTWQPYDGVPGVTALSNAVYQHAPDWYRGFVYQQEAARGLDCEEDLATPGIFHFDLSQGPAVLSLGAAEPGGGADDDAVSAAEQVFASERARRSALAAISPLARAADAYIVARPPGKTVIAGYPWFGDWGRDTFISLRGLCLATGRLDDARRVLAAWPPLMSRGMLPNCFASGDGAPAYNSVDASLWFVVAADALLARPDAACSAGERRALEDAIDQVVAGYAGGTRHGIAADTDGLLRSGQPGTQLTWMDARAHGREVTPRIGKPVEVQALWANALAAAARRDRRWSALLDRVRASFAARFWNPARGMLHDVVNVDHREGQVDSALRPNQLFAVGGGLPLALLEGPRARAVVDAVERTLWTPAGVRSLAPGEPGYTGHYGGGPDQRDGAYHQGTVWTWLAGPLCEAWVRVRGGGPAVRAEARRRFLAPLFARLAEGGLGHLGEIADGDAPHAPRGCPFQAWSVAEALRLDLVVLAGG